MSDLTLICGHCDKPVAPGAGFLGVSLRQLNEYATAYAEWKAANPGDSHDIHDLLAAPEEVPWRGRHYACAPALNDDVYAIDSERLQTWPALTGWTALLMAKDWLDDTDWCELLEQVSKRADHRITWSA